MENFGRIRDAFNWLLTEGLVNKDNSKRNVFKKYIKTIKESDVLRTEYLIYSNIENYFNQSDYGAGEYIKENIGLLNKFDRSKIKKEHDKLIKLFGKEVPDNGNKLHDSITKLIFIKKTPKTISKSQECFSYISEFIKNNEKKQTEKSSIGLPLDALKKICISKFNEKYSELSESEKKVLKHSLNKKEEAVIFEELMKECTDKIDVLMKESVETGIKNKLEKTKNKLSGMKYNKESYMLDVCKILELKNGLEYGKNL